MQRQSFYMLSFNSTHDAIHAEKALQPHLPVQVIPTLRQVSQSCGISLRVEAADFPQLRPLLAQGVVEKGSYALYQVGPDKEGAGLVASPVEI